MHLPRRTVLRLQRTRLTSRAMRLAAHALTVTLSSNPSWSQSSDTSAASRTWMTTRTTRTPSTTPCVCFRCAVHRGTHEDCDTDEAGHPHRSGACAEYLPTEARRTCTGPDARRRCKAEPHCRLACCWQVLALRSILEAEWLHDSTGAATRLLHSHMHGVLVLWSP